MTDLDKLVLWSTAVIAAGYLVGPAAVLRFAGNLLQCLVIFIAILLVSGGWPFS
jgi:hypothetical protein